MKINILTGVVCIQLLLFSKTLQVSENITLRLSDIILSERPEMDPMLELEISEVEGELISIFNEINEEKDFEIVCQKETQNGSYFFRACDPMFLLRARQSNNRAWRNGQEDLLTKQAIKAKFASRFEELDVAFARILQANSRMKEMATELYEKGSVAQKDSNL